MEKLKSYGKLKLGLLKIGGTKFGVVCLVNSYKSKSRLVYEHFEKI